MEIEATGWVSEETDDALEAIELTLTPQENKKKEKRKKEKKGKCHLVCSLENVPAYYIYLSLLCYYLYHYYVIISETEWK